MKRSHRLSVPIALALLLTGAGTALAQTPARPPAGAQGRPAQPPRDRMAELIKEVETLHGKPLTAAQKKAVIAAYQERTRARKAAQDRFRASVAKTLGVSMQQLATKEKAFFRARAQARQRGGKPAAARPQ